MTRIKVSIVIMITGIASCFAKAPLVDEAVVEYYAKYMNVGDSAIHIPELYNIIHEWIGTPYRYGRSDKKGTDCSGFVRNVFGPLCGNDLPRSASGMSKVILPKPVSELKEGDLVFFNYRGRNNSHVGIYLQNGWFVHASTVHGVTLNNLYTPYYTRRFSKGGSLKQGELKNLMEAFPNRNTGNDMPPLQRLTPISIDRVECSRS